MTVAHTTVPHMTVPPITGRPVWTDPGGQASPAGTAPRTQDGPQRPRRRRSALRLVVAAAVVVGVGAGAWIGFGAPQARAEVLESAAEVGPAPFATSVDPGGRPVCDVRGLVGQITADPVKAAAWAQPFGIQARDIPQFASGLTATTLSADTELTEYGYAGGQYSPYAAVLQTGTAALVDAHGTPRVKCVNDDPLTAATTHSASSVGTPWPGYSPNSTVVITSPPVVDPGPPVDPAPPVVVGPPPNCDPAACIPPIVVHPPICDPIACQPPICDPIACQPPVVVHPPNCDPIACPVVVHPPNCDPIACVPPVVVKGGDGVVVKGGGGVVVKGGGGDVVDPGTGTSRGGSAGKTGGTTEGAKTGGDETGH